ncbi:hypothetical protein FQR65_LT13554 [Abscondita terminalis]|nr:hypothetical protein FQR65_LT13554 [Abscondita terminalis]
MFDTDKFIVIIHGLPALCDKLASDYSNKDARQRAWVNVGESMYPEGTKFSCRERDNENKRQTTGNLEDSDDNQLVTSQIDEHGANNDEDGNSESVIENQPQSSTWIANMPYRQKRKRQNSSNITTFQSQLLKKLDENENKEEDGDKLFSASCL